MAYQIKKPKRKYRLITTVVLLLLIVAGAVYWWHFVRTPATKVITKAGNFTSSNTPANSANNPTPKKEPTNNNAQRTIGGPTDTNGQATANTNSSQWITSTSGNITVEQPLANATIQSGTTLSGTAKVSTVNYRVIDNTVGVISEGTLSVVNGKFSGNLNFTPHSSGGRLDVFSTAPNGAELNEIEIAVNF